MKNETLIVLALAVAAILAGCASEGVRVPTDVEAVLTHDFNPTDLQIITKKAVSDLLARKILPEDKPPFVYVARVRNLTDEHIGTDLIAEKIAYHLSESGKVRLSGVPKELEEAIRQLEFQQGAFVNPATAQKIGKMIGPSYFVQGELSNLVSKAGRRKGQYFLFTLTLVNIETLEVWKSQVEIQKVSKRGLFGW